MTRSVLASDGITASSVATKANRVGLLPRHGFVLSRDLEAARAIDRQAAPLPPVIFDHRNKPLRLRRCALSGVNFYSRMNRVSLQAKQPRRYHTILGAGDFGVEEKPLSGAMCDAYRKRAH